MTPYPTLTTSQIHRAALNGLDATNEAIKRQQEAQFRARTYGAGFTKANPLFVSGALYRAAVKELGYVPDNLRETKPVPLK